MEIKKLTLNSNTYPAILQSLGRSAPKQLYVAGDKFDELMKRPRVAIVGSRRPTPYGIMTTERFARELAEQGIVIVSGLALGIDAISHHAALDAGGSCLVVLPSPLERIVPSTNRRLAQRILDQGGTLVSEYSTDDAVFKPNFVARNRIVAGLADAILVTEAAVESGTRHTVRYANDQNKNVFAVPGNIFHPNSAGTNNYIKVNKAHLVTEVQDILLDFNITPHKTKVHQVKGGTANEQKLLDLMLRGVSDGYELLRESGLDVPAYNQALTMLEITAKVKPLGANHWAIH